MQEKAERNELPPPAPPMTSPNPSQGGERLLEEPPPAPPKEGEPELARKVVITYFVIINYTLCIMN